MKKNIMRTTFKVLGLLAVCIFLGEMAANGAEPQKREKRKKGKVESADIVEKTPNGVPTIMKFIREDAKKHSGFFNVYEQNKQFFVEIPDAILERDILVFTSIVKGSAQKERNPNDILGYGGDAVNSKVIRFEKGPTNRLFIKEPFHSIANSDTTSSMYKAIKSSNFTPIVYGFDIKAKGENSVLVDFTEFYNSDHAYFSLKGAPSPMNVGSYQADKSYPSTISAFDENVIFRSVKSYAPGNNTPAKGDNPEIITNATIWEIASSWYLLPEKIMRPRIIDKRVGYFINTVTSYDRQPTKAEKISRACRWRIEPKPEDLERYMQGELVEPEKPIVFYVDRNAPQYLHKYIINGVQEWQTCFEKIGFKNAIIAKITPTVEEDPNFSIEDARYSVVSYKASPIPNAYGPQVVDPRSGEVICSHVAIFHNVLDLAQKWYFTQCSPNDERVRKFPLDNDLMGKFMQYIVAHEIGHTLGLCHNFAGSWTYTVNELRDKDFVRKNSHGATIMDYMRFNYVAQPEDGIAVEDLIPKISFYDDFAINWGYKYYPQFKNEFDEAEYLRKWVTERRKENPRVFFGTEDDNDDPRYQAEDLTNDVIAANELGIKNLKRVITNLAEWTAGDDNELTLRAGMYKSVMDQYGRYITHVTKNIGGRYSDETDVTEVRRTYETVPKDIQKKSFAFIKKHLLNEPTWLLNDENAKMMNINTEQLYRTICNKTINSLINRSSEMDKQRALIGDKAYSYHEMSNDLYKAIITDKLTGKISNYSRAMQSSYMTFLIAKVGDSRTSDDLIIVTSLLDKMAIETKNAASKCNDLTTKNHLLGINRAINVWKSGKKIIL